MSQQIDDAYQQGYRDAIKQLLKPLEVSILSQQQFRLVVGDVDDCEGKLSTVYLVTAACRKE